MRWNCSAPLCQHRTAVLSASRWLIEQRKMIARARKAHPCSIRTASNLRSMPWPLHFPQIAAEAASTRRHRLAIIIIIRIITSAATSSSRPALHMSTAATGTLRCASMADSPARSSRARTRRRCLQRWSKRRSRERRPMQICCGRGTSGGEVAVAAVAAAELV